MKFIVGAFFSWTFLGCHTTTQIEVWQQQATLALQADQVHLEGFSSVGRVLDVVLVTQATTVPMLDQEDCAETDEGTWEPKVFSTLHRFRTKPGKVSIVIPELPNARALATCDPRLQTIKVIEVSSTGVVKQTLAELKYPFDSKIFLDFDHYAR